MRVQFLRIIFLSAIFVFWLATPAQEFLPVGDRSETIVESTMLDEFGRVGECELGARLDNLLLNLARNPGSQGFIIFYRGSEDLPANQTEQSLAARTSAFMNHFGFRRFDASRIVVVDGGFRSVSTFSAELWVVPEGAAIPAPTGTVEKRELPADKAFLADVKHPDLPGAYIEKEDPDQEAEPDEEPGIEPDESTAEYEESEAETTEELDEESVREAEEARTALEEHEKFYWISRYFFTALNEDESSRGVMIFYADESDFDLATAQELIRERLREYAGKEDVDLTRVKLVFGGYSESPKLEYWIVPAAAADPAPTLHERTAVQ